MTDYDSVVRKTTLYVQILIEIFCSFKGFNFLCPNVAWQPCLRSPLIVFLFLFLSSGWQTPLDIALFPPQRMIILTVLWTDSALEIDTRTVVLQYGFQEILEDLTGSCFFFNSHRDTRRCWIDFPSNARKLLTSRKLSRALMWIKITSLTLRNGEPIWNRMWTSVL